MGPASEDLGSDVAETDEGPQHVIVEIRIPSDKPLDFAFEFAQDLKAFGFHLDPGFEPVPTVEPEITSEDVVGERVVLIRGTLETNSYEEVKSAPKVVDVLLDTPIAPFVWDCDPTSAKGSADDVVAYLGVDEIWKAGFQGEETTIAIVDGGIAAAGRTTAGKIGQVKGGWPEEDWGQSAEWGGHGNMCAADALAMAPKASLYDIRIADGSRISNAIAGFHWAINKHKEHEGPDVLCNGWGIHQKAIDPAYATNPNHPFTRKVVEAVNEGIIVVFAAGNCGDSCPWERCGVDNGPGRSIWGANGHPSVITVGAANARGELIGYSSQGPASLDRGKPDFCSISHFKGYFDCDTGTSTACAVTAGVAALLNERQASLTTQAAKKLLRDTARPAKLESEVSAAGAGIIQAKAAFDRISPKAVPRGREWRVPWIKDGLPEQDLLGRRPLARSLARQLRWIHEEPPRMSFLIHVDGPWGSGKSTLLHYLREELENAKEGQQSEDFICVELNAWREQGIGPPWWSLLSALRQRNLHSVEWIARPGVWLLDMWDRLRAAWVPYVAALLVLVGVLAAAFTFGGVGSSNQAETQQIERAGALAQAVGSFLALGGTLLGGAMALTKLGLLGSTRSARLFVETDDNPMENIRQLFTRSLNRVEKPTVFIIDDLDRANETYVVEFLEAVQTIVRDYHGPQSTGGPYFVVAADGRWIRTSYEKAYETFRDVQSPGVPLGYLFLEKIFQLTVRLPRITEDVRNAYFASILDPKRSRLSKKEQEADAQKQKELNEGIESARTGAQIADITGRADEIKDPYAKLQVRGSAAVKLSDPQILGRTTEHALEKFSSFLDPNPREIKLFVNKYSILRALRILEGEDIEIGPLGLWTIVEMRWPALADYLRLHPEDVDRVGSNLRPKDLAEDENLGPLFESAEVRDVICNADLGPLTPDLVRKCAG